MLDQLQTEGQCCGMADWSEFNSPSVKGWNGVTVGRDPRTDQSELWDRRKHTIISDRPKRLGIYDVRSSFCRKIVWVDRTVDLMIDKKTDRDRNCDRSGDRTIQCKNHPFSVPWGQNSLNLYLSVPSTCCRTDGGQFGSFLNLSECQKGTEEFIHKDGCHAKVNGHIQTAQETTKVFNPIFLSQ